MKTWKQSSLEASGNTRQTQMFLLLDLVIQLLGIDSMETVTCNKMVITNYL